MRRHLGRTIPLIVMTVVLLALGNVTASAGPAIHQSSGVYQFDDGSHAGSASLTRTNSGISLRLGTTIGGELTDFGMLLGEDWRPGDATTVWLVVFNEPGNCVGGCGEDEVIDAATGGANAAEVGLHYGAGHVAGGDRFHAAATLREWDTSGRVFGMPLKDAQTAEIHTVVRSHGPAATLTGRQLSAAIHSLMGGCETNTCGDPQFAVFPAP